MTSGRESSEDYLEAILVIRRERGWYRNIDIAERLGVTSPSVTKALAGLSSRSHAQLRQSALNPAAHAASTAGGMRRFRPPGLSLGRQHDIERRRRQRTSRHRRRIPQL